jgi:hypothetical protein
MAGRKMPGDGESDSVISTRHKFLGNRRGRDMERGGSRVRLRWTRRGRSWPEGSCRDRACGAGGLPESAAGHRGAGGTRPGGTRPRRSRAVSRRTQTGHPGTEPVDPVPPFRAGGALLAPRRGPSCVRPPASVRGSALGRSRGLFVLLLFQQVAQSGQLVLVELAQPTLRRQVVDDPLGRQRAQQFLRRQPP